MERCPKNSCTNLWGQSLPCGKGLSPRDGKLGKVNFVCGTVGHKSAPLKIAFKENNKSQCISYWHQLATINYSGVIKRLWRLPVSHPGHGQRRRSPGRACEKHGCAAPWAAQPWSVPLVPICLSPEHRDPPRNPGQPLPQPQQRFIKWTAGNWIHLFPFPALCHRHPKWRMDVAKMSLSFCSDFQIHLPPTCIVAAQPTDPSQIICIEQTHECVAVPRWAPSESQDLWPHPYHQCHGQDGTDSPTA